MLGGMYANAEGVPEDVAEAATWYRRAAEQGYASAQYSLGLAHFTGQGVAKDLMLTHMWLNIAAANGYDRAREWRNKIDDYMTTAQVSDAMQRARTCQASDYKDCD